MPLSSNPDGIELEPVPTMAQLTARNLARLIKYKNVNHRTGKVTEETRYQATPEGQQLIYDTQKRNAQRSKEHYDQPRTGPREPARPQADTPAAPSGPADGFPF